MSEFKTTEDKFKGWWGVGGGGVGEVDGVRVVVQAELLIGSQLDLIVT